MLRGKVVEFVRGGDFGLASGANENGEYDRLWYGESVHPDEVVFEHGVFLLTKEKAEQLRAMPEQGSVEPAQDDTGDIGEEETTSNEEQNGTQEPAQGGLDIPTPQKTTLRIAGTVPSETWNRMGTSLITKLRAKEDLRLTIDIIVSVDANESSYFENDLRQTLDDLGLNDQVRVEATQRSG